MKLISLIAGILIITSCSVLKKQDIKGFTSEGNTVLYNGVAMAELVAVEFALDNHKIVKELTFTVTDGSYNDKILNLIAYLHGRFADYEIEVEIPIDKYKDLK